MSITLIRIQSCPRGRLPRAVTCVLGLILCGMFSACERPEIVAPDRGNFVAPSQSGIGFDLVDGSFRIDGVTRTNRLNLSTDRFAYLFVFVKSKGMYIVTAEESEAGIVAGRFSGDRLTFEVNGTRIELETAQGYLLEDQLDRSAWVEYLPDYDLLGPDARPDDAVVGLAPQKNQIPGFVDQQ